MSFWFPFSLNASALGTWSVHGITLLLSYSPFYLWGKSTFTDILTDLYSIVVQHTLSFCLSIVCSFKGILRYSSALPDFGVTFSVIAFSYWKPYIVFLQLMLRHFYPLSFTTAMQWSANLILFKIMPKYNKCWKFL